MSSALLDSRNILTDIKYQISWNIINCQTQKYC